jgi:hypothetical protein
MHGGLSPHARKLWMSRALVKLKSQHPSPVHSFFSWV